MIEFTTINEILDIVRSDDMPLNGWANLVALCARVQPSEMWDSLGVPDVERDVREASDWIEQQLMKNDPEGNTRGIYLGLDTLNMDNDPEHFPCMAPPENVQIGGTTNCDPAMPRMDWSYDCQWHGDEHLILGLRPLNHVYMDDRWPESLHDFADYAIFLGYSGVVLSEALRRLKTRATFLAVWGFHDGDMFYLARKLDGLFERLAQLEFDN
ncbi:MAG: hypothetical protein DWQ35_05790 [Planctomycetota bacterium]|nr:MAG: hypothetical protein DWQ35_05790 [Planctomycetota bacterium]REK25340.1 MAG: hypothetical protein DWQ42_11485 [Planctomycetota bacterium]REK43475.1 MAG: hypothetical protein DWQ46_11230 [Planctomycetota bacterium]